MNVRWLLAVAVLVVPLSAHAAGTLPYCVLSNAPGTYYPGSKVRLMWYTENATAAAIAGIGPVALQGYYDVYPQQNTTYTMTAANSMGSRTCGALVTITRPQTTAYQMTPVQPVTYTPLTWTYNALPVTKTYAQTVYNDRGYDNWYSTSNYYNPYSYPGSRYSYEYFYDEPSNYYRDAYTYTSPLGTPYTQITPYSQSNGYGASVTQDCISGLGCSVTGMNREIPYNDPRFNDPVPAVPQAPQNTFPSAPYGGAWDTPVYQAPAPAPTTEWANYDTVYYDNPSIDI